MSKKHVQHKVTYCCDQGLSFFKSELDEAVDVGIKAGIDYERDRIIKLVSHEVGVMEKAGGATFGKRKDYDEGYNAALRDIAILIKGENK